MCAAEQDIRPMLGNPDSGIQEFFASGIRSPGLWNPESSTKNPESYQRLESGIQLTKDPLKMKLSYTKKKKTVHGKPPQGIDLNVTT